MVTWNEFPIPADAHKHLRPVQPHRDLPEVADLIELCFRDTLDLEGRSYLRYLRRMARKNPVFRWASSLAEMVNGLPVSGLVWQEENRIVGNLSLIPLTQWRKHTYLIANVAVHPDFRGRGIARTLTTTALSYLRRQKVDTVWLQVRDDNPPAIHIYQSLGFEEVTRRTTWYCQQKPAPISFAEGYRLGQRLASHWADQARWLQRLYPEELRWNMPLRWRLFQPGLLGGLTRFFSLEIPIHWTIQRAGRLLAVLSELDDGGPTIPLWLAAPEENQLDESAICALLIFVAQQNGKTRPFSLNLPAGYASQAIRSAGFNPQQTLIWMRINF